MRQGQDTPRVVRTRGSSVGAAEDKALFSFTVTTKSGSCMDSRFQGKCFGASDPVGKVAVPSPGPAQASKPQGQGGDGPTSGTGASPARPHVRGAERVLRSPLHRQAGAGQSLVSQAAWLTVDRPASLSLCLLGSEELQAECHCRPQIPSQNHRKKGGRDHPDPAGARREHPVSRQGRGEPGKSGPCRGCLELCGHVEPPGPLLRPGSSEQAKPDQAPSWGCRAGPPGRGRGPSCAHFSVLPSPRSQGSWGGQT